MTAKPINLAVLVSGSGTTLQNLIDLIDQHRLQAKITQVIGSRREIKGVDRAIEAGLPTAVVPRKDFPDTSSFSTEVFSLIDQAGVDLICCAGWLSLLDVPQRWSGKIMNIHPALLPSFGGKGMFGLHVHEAVIAYGCKVSGCTVHFLDNTYDTGPIILQRVCPVFDDDTPHTLAARVFEEEKIAYPQAITLFAQGRLQIQGRRVHIV